MRKTSNAQNALLRLAALLPEGWGLEREERSYVPIVAGESYSPRKAWEALAILVLALLHRGWLASEIRKAIRLDVRWTLVKGDYHPTIPGSLPAHYEYALERVIIPHPENEV